MFTSVIESSLTFPRSRWADYRESKTQKKEMSKLLHEFAKIPYDNINQRMSYIGEKAQHFAVITDYYSRMPDLKFTFNKSVLSEEGIKEWQALLDDVRFQLDLMNRQDLFEHFEEYKERNPELASRLSAATRKFLFGLFLVSEESQILKGKLTQWHYDLLETLLLEVETLFDSIMLPRTEFHKQLLEKAKQAYIESA